MAEAAEVVVLAEGDNVAAAAAAAAAAATAVAFTEMINYGKKLNSYVLMN